MSPEDQIEQLRIAQVALLAKITLQEARMEAMEEFLGELAGAASGGDSIPSAHPTPQATLQARLRERTWQLAHEMMGNMADENAALAGELRRMLDRIGTRGSA